MKKSFVLSLALLLTMTVFAGCNAAKKTETPLEDKTVSENEAQPEMEDQTLADGMKEFRQGMEEAKAGIDEAKEEIGSVKDAMEDAKAGMDSAKEAIDSAQELLE